jgi:hypothetical protein
VPFALATSGIRCVEGVDGDIGSSRVLHLAEGSDIRSAAIGVDIS